MISEIKADFGCYYKRNASILKRMANFLVVILEPGFCASFLYRIEHFLYKKGFYFIALLLLRFNKLLTHTEISFEATIGGGLRLPHCNDIVIGATSIVGENVEVLNGVTLGATDLRKAGKRHPTVDDNVLLGTGAKVLGNISIGANSIIGANSVVIMDIPENVIAVGIPAKIINESINNN